MKTMTLMLFLLSTAPLVFAQDKKPELPVTKVVLFSSGVGYFEHTGFVDGETSVPLVFNVDQINDVLKSLVLRDAGGSVAAVNYPSQDPAERTLRSFAIDLSGPGGLASLIPQLRGLEMTLATPGEVVGRLVGFETVEKPGLEGAPSARTEMILTLNTSTGLRNIPLGSVTQLQLKDAKLNDELAKALGLLAGLRNEQRKNVTVVFKGKGRRAVSAGYISEAPVWKTSYRLDLSGDKPYLQGWAIVENTSETDWSEVSLSLVSGRPISFIQDLYTPLYVNRPVYTPELEAGPAPRINEEAKPMAAPAPMASAPAAAKAMEKRPVEYNELSSSGYGDQSVRLKDSGVAAAASGEVTGELFQFTVRNPVTLPRHQSAMLPLAAGEVQAEKVSLYNPSVMKSHPMNAVQIVNTTGLRLPAGPITIFDGGAYAGDSLTDTMVENDKRLWSYATDLSVAADSNTSSTRKTVKISIVNGILTYKRENTYTKTYTFQNKSPNAKTLLVEHPYSPSKTLLEPSAAEEKTAALYRFKTTVAANKTQELKVVEKETLYETQSIIGLNSGFILTLVGSSEPLTPSVKAALQKAAELKVKADRLQQESSSLVQQKAEEESSQSRYRNNISTVGRDSTQGQSYLKKLMDSESKIEALEGQIKDKKAEQQKAQKELEDYLRTLNLE